MERVSELPLLRPFPEMPADVPRTLARAAQLGKPLKLAMSLADYHRRNALVWAAQDQARDKCGVHIIDPLPALCDDTECPAMADGVVRYYDDNHLTETGNRRLIGTFKPVFAINTDATNIAGHQNP